MRTKRDSGKEDRHSSNIPIKRLGQHFLTDKNIADKIIKKAGISIDDIVVEIGAGKGALTNSLVRTGAHIVAVEIDTCLATELECRYPGVEVLGKDALTISYHDLAVRFSRPLVLIGNLPYNISSPLLFRFLEDIDSFSAMTLMFQREVAERITAQKGGKKYGILSVFCNLLTDSRILFHLSPACFYPRPEVDSSVVRFDIPRKAMPAIHLSKPLKKIVKTAFGNRRKTILNALKPLGINTEKLKICLSDAGIKPSQRAETIGPESFLKLSELLKSP